MKDSKCFDDCEKTMMAFEVFATLHINKIFKILNIVKYLFICDLLYIIVSAIIYNTFSWAYAVIGLEIVIMITFHLVSKLSLYTNILLSDSLNGEIIYKLSQKDTTEIYNIYKSLKEEKENE